MTARQRGPDVERKLARRIGLSRLAIAWERLWPALWPTLATCALFLGLALLDLWSALPGWLHLAGLVLFAIALGCAVRAGVRAYAAPDEHTARRRLERINALAHRPLTTLEDGQAGGREDEQSRRLWSLHKAAARLKLVGLRIGIPRAGLARRDPWALRTPVALVLMLGVVAGYADWEGRLARAFVPDLSGPPPVPASLDVWVSPPAYTGLPPAVLDTEANQEALLIPDRSELLARVHGGEGTPALIHNDARRPFESLDALNHRLTATLSRGGTLGVVQGETMLAAWAIEIIPDQPPEVEFAESPGRTMRASLRVAYEARDDYGLASVKLRVQRPESAELLDLELPLPAPGRREVAETSYHDLTAHPWAGLPARIKLVAEDGIGQLGFSGEIETVLPERIFNHPVARAIVEQRKALTLDPTKRRRVARALDAIAAEPRHFFEDTVAYLALRTARWRLLHDEEAAAVAEVQALLWDTALRIEDGGVSIAERDLRAAQRALMEALSSDAPDEEIERLIDQLQAALDRFLQKLAEQAREMVERGEISPIDPDSMVLESQDLRDLIEQARRMAQAGAREAARQLLAQLQELLENLQSGTFQPQFGQGQSEMRNALRGLGELMQRQQRLLDDTFRESQRRRGGQQQQGRLGSPQDMAARQEALRRTLGEIMRRLGEGLGQIPVPLGNAERAMRDSRESLGAGRPGESTEAQGLAIEEMRRGARSMIDQMLEQLAGTNQGQAGFGRMNPNLQDPLGRPYEGGNRDGGRAGGHVDVPDRGALEQAREILRELHRRAGQRHRSSQELDYIERLLRRF